MSDVWQKDLEYLIQATARRPPSAGEVLKAANAAGDKWAATQRPKNATERKNVAHERSQIVGAFVKAHANSRGVQQSYERWRATQRGGKKGL